MSRSTRWIAAACVACCMAASPSLAQVKVEADKENVVASRLEGQWEVNAELSRHLDGRESAKVSFKGDPAVAGKVPAKYLDFLKGKRVYMAGIMARGAKEYPFILIEHRGNPHIVYFRERGGDAYGDAESFNVIVAVARDTQNDILFIGGDFNNQPFSAYGREKAKE